MASVLTPGAHNLNTKSLRYCLNCVDITARNIKRPSSVKHIVFPSLQLGTCNICSKKVALLIERLGAKHLIGQTNHALSQIEPKDKPLDDRIHAAVCLSIADGMRSLMDGTCTTHQAWLALKYRFGESELQCVINVIEQLFASTQKDLFVSEYIAQVEQRVRHGQAIAADPVQVSDCLQGLIILMGASWEYKSSIDSIDTTSTDINSSNVEAMLVTNS